MATVQRPLGSTNQVRPVFSSETAIHPDPRTSLSQAANWIPIVGDWDGNGTTTIGVYEPSTASFYLRNSNTPGVADITIAGYGGANRLIDFVMRVRRAQRSSFELKKIGQIADPSWNKKKR